ncbi:MAG: amidohydrolase family protein [Treponema sp.]|nr:amidohydrolase family protein [Treponema sp.]
MVDERTDTFGSVVVENGRIRELIPGGDDSPAVRTAAARAAAVIEGENFGSRGGLVLMPSFVDLHAHFREAAFSAEPPGPAETIESGCLAAAAGGYGAAVCMANTRPVTDRLEQAEALRRRAGALGLIDLYPALSLTRGMEGRELSEITRLAPNGGEPAPGSGANAAGGCRLISEDGKDLPNEELFLAALAAARRAGIPVSCHCDLGGEDAATARALALARRAGAPVHIAHVSTAGAMDLIRGAKKAGGRITCEVTPHHISLTEADAAALGPKSHGRVNPPLRREADRRALIEAVAGGTVDAIATDHAPHGETDKERGAPGFSGLETAFAVCYTALAAPEPETPGGRISLSRLSSLMSAGPARILGLTVPDADPDGAPPRGFIAPGYKADLCAADLSAVWTVDPAAFKSRGKNSPFRGKTLRGKIVLTIKSGRPVFGTAPP